VGVETRGDATTSPPGVPPGTGDRRRGGWPVDFVISG